MQNDVALGACRAKGQLPIAEARETNRLRETVEFNSAKVVRTLSELRYDSAILL